MNRATNVHSIVRIGASVPGQLDALKAFRDLKLGDLVLTKLPLDKDQALALARFCRENKIYFLFSEFLRRGSRELCFGRPDQQRHAQSLPLSQFHSPRDLGEIFRAGGQYFLGRISLGEIGGFLYWPQAYLKNRAVGGWPNLPTAQTLLQAKRALVDTARKILRFERRQIADCPLFSVEASMIHKYLLAAGADLPLLELMPGDCTFMTAAIRGAARAARKNTWGTHIAMGWYGGFDLDTLWKKRWKISLYHCFLAGSPLIYSESGHVDYTMGQNTHAFDSSAMKDVRRILREFNQFAHIHTRPARGPKTTLAFVHGHLDGFPGLWNKHVWGQHKGKKWLPGPAESAWDLFHTLYRKYPWDNENAAGQMDFSGNPPYGQTDIVPIEAPLPQLQKYSCLVFLGWNTITKPIYDKLKAYVHAGGRLLMSVPHLTTNTDRRPNLPLYRNGDWADLFGVRVQGPRKTEMIGTKTIAAPSCRSWKIPLPRIRSDPRFIGPITLAQSEIIDARVIVSRSTFFFEDRQDLLDHPLLTEKRLGKGSAFLIHACQWPGDPALRPFVEHLLRVVAAGEQADIRTVGSDKIRYAVYNTRLPRSAVAPRGHRPPRNLTTIYLLNTDYDVPHFTRLWIRGHLCPPLRIDPTEMALLYCSQNLLIAPQDRATDLQSWSETPSAATINLFSRTPQSIQLRNLSDHPIRITLNRRSLTCQPGKDSSIAIKIHIDPQRSDYFHPQYLDEPTIKWDFDELPY